MDKEYAVDGKTISEYQTQYAGLMEKMKTAHTVEELNDCKPSFLAIMPELEIMVDYDQQNYAHQYDLWNHCLHTVINLPRCMQDDMLYLAALLHDIGKPDCQCRGTREDDKNMHYYGHPRRSMEIVHNDVISRLEQIGIKLSEDEKKRLLYYVEFHDDRVSLRLNHMRRHLNMGVSFKEFQNLMVLQVADARAHVMIPIVEKRIEICSKLAGKEGEEIYQRIQNGE